MTFVLGDLPEKLTMSSEFADAAGLLSSQGMIPRLKFHRVAPDA